MRNDYLGSCYSTITYPTLSTVDLIPVSSIQVYEDISTSTAQYTSLLPRINVMTSLPSLLPSLTDGLIPALGSCQFATVTSIVNTLPTSPVIHWSKDATNPQTYTFSGYSITTTCSDTSFIYEAYSNSVKSPLKSFVTFNPTSRTFTFNSLAYSDIGSYTIGVFATLTNA
jgi:hypothetical protein